MTAPTVTSETKLTPERVRELRDGFKRDAKVPDDLSSDPASGLYHEIIALCDHWLATHATPQAALTGEQWEACERGAHWTSERGRFSADLATSIENGMVTLADSEVSEVFAYIAKLRDEAATHERHAALLRALAAGNAGKEEA